MPDGRQLQVRAALNAKYEELFWCTIPGSRLIIKVPLPKYYLGSTYRLESIPTNSLNHCTVHNSTHAWLAQLITWFAWLMHVAYTAHTVQTVHMVHKIHMVQMVLTANDSHGSHACHGSHGSHSSHGSHGSELHVRMTRTIHMVHGWRNYGYTSTSGCALRISSFTAIIPWLPCSW